ncbi:MAG: response regulator transcription factor [Myxococcales bacterium]|jgi:DNA-binding NarL/FixJ family response regulator|nr:response regulator transcription factor [Myxococcales bacterium]
MQIGILEDDAEVREAIARLVSKAGHEPVTYLTTAALRDAVAAGEAPGLLLLDLDFGAERTIDLAPKLLALRPELSLVALTGHAGDDWVFPALEAGFVGYVLKSDAFDRLGGVIDEVARGGSPLSGEVARRVVGRLARRPEEPSPVLSPRELDVLRHLSEGYSYEQVALHLGISLGSVRTYVSRLYTKLGVSTKSEATALAMRRKWIG